MLISDSGPDRMTKERVILERYFPQFVLRQDLSPSLLGQGITTTARGTLTTFASQSREVELRTTSAYPDDVPTAHAIGWTPVTNPHIYTDMSLCLMRSPQWIPQYSLAFAVAKTALWLNKYEFWIDQKIWPGNEQHIHGPLYSFRKWWDEL